VRLTAVFRGTQGPGGVVCPETGRLYVMFDMAGAGPYDPDDEQLQKGIAGACQHYLDSLSGQPELIEVLVGGFMPRSLYSDPIGQMKREGRAKRVLLYTYERPKGG
jgi:hypothetical protein